MRLRVNGDGGAFVHILLSICWSIHSVQVQLCFQSALSEDAFSH